MMSAISAKEKNPKNEVIILEKNNQLGKKFLITGKGRCNITSSLDMEDFIKNIPGNGRFLYSAFNEFTNKDIINFLKEEGLEVKKERGDRTIPCAAEYAVSGSAAEDLKNRIRTSALKRDIVLKMISRIEVQDKRQLKIYYRFAADEGNCGFTKGERTSIDK